MNQNKESFQCEICGQDKPRIVIRLAEMVAGPVGDLIRKHHPDWNSRHKICQSCLRRFRTEYIEKAMAEQRGELTELENKVIFSLEAQELLARNVNPEFDKELTYGQKLADKVATFGGSWRFIIIFAATLFAWVVINSVFLMKRPFDPYPFILLNLILSCLAAIQAPLIMMSQNRQEAKDRMRAEFDYQVNLKAEIEIRQLHVKIDQLMNHSWQRLLEIQQVQMEIMEDLSERKSPGESNT